MILTKIAMVKFPSLNILVTCIEGTVMNPRNQIGSKLSVKLSMSTGMKMEMDTWIRKKFESGFYQQVCCMQNCNITILFRYLFSFFVKLNSFFITSRLWSHWGRGQTLNLWVWYWWWLQTFKRRNSCQLRFIRRISSNWFWRSTDKTWWILKILYIWAFPKYT